MALRRALAWLLLALLVADGLALTPGARAFTTVAFNTTALFDTGTKTNVSTASDTCENVTANALQLNNTGNYQGIGLTTGKANCATGAWGVSANGLLLSYDMQTLSAGKMRDFSPSSNNGAMGGPISVVGKYGLAQSFDGVRENITATRTVNQNSSFTVSFWAKVTGGASTFRSPVSQMTPTPTAGWIIYATVANIWSLWVWQGGSWGVVDLTVPTAIGTWFFFTAKWDAATHTAGFSVNNTALKWVIISNPVPWSYCPLSIGRRMSNTCQDTTFAFPGIVDELLVFNRNLTASEDSALYLNGRSSFLSSGSWLSPVQSGQVPIQAQLSFTGQTASDHISRFRVQSPSGITVYDSGPIGAFLTSPLTLDLSNITFFPATWKVRVDMIGNGSATSAITSILLTVGSPPTLDPNAMVFIVFLILVFGLGLAGFGLEVPVLTILGGIAGFVFGGWLFFSVGASNVPMAVVLWGVSSAFMLMGAVMALQVGD